MPTEHRGGPAEISSDALFPLKVLPFLYTRNHRRGPSPQGTNEKHTDNKCDGAENRLPFRHTGGIHSLCFLVRFLLTRKNTSMSVETGNPTIVAGFPDCSEMHNWVSQTCENGPSHLPWRNSVYHRIVSRVGVMLLDSIPLQMCRIDDGDSPGMSKIDVIIPAYNAARYLPMAIESVVAQTFRDWKIVLVDDGSTDNTLEVVSPFIQQLGPRLQYIKQTNGGLPAARNTAIRNSSAEFLALLDADDVWLPCRLSESLRYFERQQVGLTYGLISRIDSGRSSP